MGSAGDQNAIFRDLTFYKTSGGNGGRRRLPGGGDSGSSGDDSGSSGGDSGSDNGSGSDGGSSGDVEHVVAVSYASG